MVKRKDPAFDKKEKVKKAVDTVRKVSKKLNFDEMYDVISEDGRLLVPVKSEVFFERTKESKTVVCIGTIVSVYPTGGVDVWDETNNDFYLFNHKKHHGIVKVRALTLPTEGSQELPVQPAVVTSPSQSEGTDLFEALNEVADILEDGADEHLTARDIEDHLNNMGSAASIAHVEECEMCARNLDLARAPHDFGPRAEAVEPDKIEVLGPPPKKKEPLKFKLFVDDERSPPDDTWVVARSTKEAFEFIEAIGINPHIMSLDHDLGGDDKIIHFLTELEERYQDRPVPEYLVHSQNPVGRANTIAFMEAWKKSRS
jgi:hypothetical protein